MITIKKYTNRRLYDSSNSRYVNLEDVEELVRKGSDLEVIDDKTGKDVTQAILTQIILAGAKRRDRALPVELLRQMIIASGRTQHELLSRYLTFVTGIYDRAQADLKQRVSGARDDAANPMDTVIKTLFPERASNAEATVDDESVDEIAALRKRIDDLEARLASESAKIAN